MPHPPLTRTADAAEVPLDVETADRSADMAFALQLGTTTREEIDSHTLRLKGQVELFADVVREGESVEARGSWLEAYHLLQQGPSDDVLVFAAWSYVRDLARVLRRLASEYRNQQTQVRAPLPSSTPLAALPLLAASRQTYRVPPAAA
ncbi:DUF6415 family natural product biosynthesis protein [Streptomyces californicus]|uniref:DUF6415 family natural product biosynthesis protein n=1 Tax=Streptomyces californicus TaxID=67351 RepID=UPI0036A1AC7B